MLYEWGAKEIMVSHNSEMLVYDGAEYYTCPVKARNLSGRTGRGDTTFGAYLAKRMTGASIADALLFATAAVSRKMESPGPITGTEADVYDYIHTAIMISTSGLPAAYPGNRTDQHQYERG